MLYNESLTPENINDILKDLAKAYKKLSSTPAEITLVGGAAILVNYGFRQQSDDIDAIIQASSVMKEVANKIGDKYNLPFGWLNSDFMHTNSYTPKIEYYSIPYREYSHILQIRTMPPEYIVAMKLMSGRPYKHDLSDVIGILYEQQEKGQPLTEDKICIAFENLYDDIEKMPDNSYNLLMKAFATDNLIDLMEQIKCSEERKGNLLKDFQEKYKNVVKEDNILEILEQLDKKQDNDYPDFE